MRSLLTQAGAREPPPTTAFELPERPGVHMTRLQAELAANAAGIDAYADTAAEALNQAGISGERAVTVASRVEPATATKTLRTVLGDMVAGDGRGSTKAEGRLVLVTDQRVRVFKGSRLSEAPGQVLGTYPVGTGALAQTKRQVTFPDGKLLEFANPSEAKRAIEAAGGR